MVESNPTVAVVLPAYNVGPYIGAALASIAADQRMPPSEVILVDDASSDDTVERAKAWLDRLPLQIIELGENIGCGAARSVAIRAATADIIAPLDGDDVWLPEHLATVCRELVDERTIVAAGFLRWDGRDPGAATPLRSEVPAAPDQADEILERNFLSSGSIYHRRTLLDRAGGPSSLRRGEDRDTWIRMIWLGGCTVVPSPRPTVLYRTRSESLSANEGCLPGTIEMLEGYLADGTIAVDPDRLRRLIRRRRARVAYLEALDVAEVGDANSARRRMVSAALLDRSLHGWLRPAEQGSVTIRALLAAVHPSRVARRRRSRMAAAGLAVEPAR